MSKKINRFGSCLLFLVSCFFLCNTAMATTETVQEQEPQYKYATKPSELTFIQKTPSRDKLVSDMTFGVIQGVDSNPLLDSTHKADNYTEETLDMHFRYPVFGSVLGSTNSKFGFNIMNINYYRINDVDIFDGAADVNIEQEIFDKFTLGIGYMFELMWFPHDENGNFVGNEFNVSLKQKLSDKAYHKFTYRLVLRDYLERKARLGNGTLSDDLRNDLRNVFGYEAGFYIGDSTKLKALNQFYINESNDKYFDYYDYVNNRVGVSVVQHIFKNLYGTAGIYYQRRVYDSRQISDGYTAQRDNLYLVSGSLLYDVTKNISVFFNYSHMENHTNEPLEKYIDTLFSGGLYYSF